MKVPRQLIDAIERVTSASSAENEVGVFTKELLPLLLAAKALIRDGESASLSGTSGSATRYVVENSVLGETLAERRMGGRAKPLRCPKAVYYATVEIMSSATSPQSIAPIVAAVMAMGVDAGEFQVRVALRFWLQCDPPLLIRSRARYRAANPAQFSVQAHQIWHTK